MRIAWLVTWLVVGGCGSAPSVAPSPPVAAAHKPAAPPTPLPPAPPGRYPPTERRPVTDSYGSVKVVDDYRWLEANQDSSVIAWTAAQNKVTRQTLDALPDR